MNQQYKKKKNEKFYSTLDNAKVLCKSLIVLIVVIDPNAKVGRGREGKIDGQFRARNP